MPSMRLSKLLHDRATDTEKLIEKGHVFFYSRPVNNKTHYFIPPQTHVDDAAVSTPDCFCWTAPGKGTAIIEIWGGGGSSTWAADNSYSMSGNAGAYSKKTIRVDNGGWIQGIVGDSTYSTASGVQAWDRSCATEICWFSGVTTDHGCMCAEGGASGYRWCANGNIYCCYTNDDFYHEHWLTDDAIACTGCGWICNKKCTPGTHGDEAEAFGGDVNLVGPISKTKFFGSAANSNRCCIESWTPFPHGLFYSGQNSNVDPDGRCGAAYTMTRIQDCRGNGLYMAGEQAVVSVVDGRNFLTRQVTSISTWNCFTGRTVCACHDGHMCTVMVPIGTGAPPAMSCSGHCDKGHRGGVGAVKIRFIKE